MRHPIVAAVLSSVFFVRAAEAHQPEPPAEPPLVAPPPNAPPEPPPAPDHATQARLQELETRFAEDEAKIKPLETSLGPLRNLQVQGFVQAQYLVESVNAAASPNL